MITLRKFESGESIYDRDFRDKLNALVDAMNASQQSSVVAAQRSQQYTRSGIGIPVELTGYGSAPGYYEFSEVWCQASPPDWGAKSGGLTHTQLGEARCRGGWKADDVNYPIIGRVVYLYPALAIDSSGDRIFEFDPPAPIVFPILLTQTGGSGGTATAACSFTYTVTDVDANSLGTTIDPTASPHTHKRTNLGTLAAATAGLAYYGNNAGAPQLRIVWCNEVISVSECS